MEPTEPTLKTPDKGGTDTTPKSDLFAWCSRHKIKPPVFELEYTRGVFEGRASLALPDGSALRTEVHTATAKKAVEQATCAELLAIMTRLFGPEMYPPRPPKKNKPKSSPAARPSPDAIAAARSAAKERARLERQERLRKVLEGWSRSNIAEVLAVLKHEGFARSVRIHVASQRGGMMLLEASCERPDGSTVHVQPFWTRTREEGERIAAVQLVESIAQCAAPSAPSSPAKAR